MDIDYSKSIKGLIKMPKIEVNGLEIICDCGKIHYLRTLGEDDGNWECTPCGRLLAWKVVLRVVTTNEDQIVKKEPDIMDIFATRRK